MDSEPLITRIEVLVETSDGRYTHYTAIEPAIAEVEVEIPRMPPLSGFLDQDRFPAVIANLDQSPKVTIRFKSNPKHGIAVAQPDPSPAGRGHPR